MPGWVAGLAGNIATSAQLKLKLGLSLAIKRQRYHSLTAKVEARAELGNI